MRIGLNTSIVGGSLINPFAVYAAGGFTPETVAGYDRNKFRADGVETTASGLVNFSTNGNRTMTDSDGLLKWAPHNLALNSASPATQDITVVSGADYTVECEGAGSVTLSDAGTGSVTEGSPVEVTASTTTLTLTVVGVVTKLWAYRSDLGGMA